jgi:D-sedoheptulose 7-phosphate isomerase
MISPQVSFDFAEATELLSRFTGNTENLIAITRAGKLMLESIKANGKIIACGNGGSMSDAMHFAEELAGRFRENRRPLPALAVSDPSFLSCTANDYGYDAVFSRFIEAFGNEGDVLLAISTGGGSRNVINAAVVARERGMMVVGLTGRDGGELASLCDVEIRVPHSGYADRIQEIHIKVIHSLIRFIEEGI